MDYAHERTTPPRRNSHSPHTWHMPTRVDRSQKRDFLIPCAACVSRSTTHRRKTRIPPTHYLCQQTHHTPYTTEGNHPPPHALLVTMPPSLSLSHAQHVSVGVPHIAERHVFHPHTTCVSEHTTHHTPQKETSRHPTHSVSPCTPSLSLSHAQHVSVGARALRPFIGFSRGKAFQKNNHSLFSPHTLKV